jgi:arabinose-5-phosphate isomerase
MDIIREAKKVFDIEIETLESVKNNLGTEFEKVVRSIADCEGRVIFIGMGKSAHIAGKISATMSSLGVPSFFLNAGECAHGDLGLIQEKDVVVLISNSGETEEIIQIIPSLKKIQAKIISITGNRKSTLERNSGITLKLNIIQEACSLNLAPTSSTTAVLVLGDALAVVLSRLINFTSDRFAVYHPKGALGKRLLTYVRDLMYSGAENPVIHEEAAIKDVIIKMNRDQMGIVNVVDENNKLTGIITNKELLDCVDKNGLHTELKASAIMNRSPKVVKPDMKASEIMEMVNSDSEIWFLTVINDYFEPIGVVKVKDFIRMGLSA